MSKKHLKISFIFMIIGGCMAKPSYNIFADYDYIKAKIYHYKPFHRIRSHISLNSQNRINFGNYGIKEIIGDDSLYQVIHDSSGHNIFIIPKVPVGEIIDITIISNGHKVQDLSLEVVDDLSQTIIICFDISVDESNEK